MRVSIIVAMTPSRVIGREGRLPWSQIPSDMRRFKKMTLGHTVIMGRKTYESLPELFRPLPNRTNVVVSRNLDYFPPGCITAHTLEYALQLCREELEKEEVFIIGGSEIYQQALDSDLVDRLYVTEVSANLIGDRYFPEVNPNEWRSTWDGYFDADEKNEYQGHFWIYDRYLVEPENARNPLYRTQLERIQASGQCPFCPGGETLRQQEILYENAGWWISPNRSPLAGSSHHFILVPIRHMLKMAELTAEEHEAFNEACRWLEETYQLNGIVYYWREGNMRVTGATVAHLHLQAIVPDPHVTLHLGKYPNPNPV